jgi:multidrug efflux pump
MLWASESRKADIVGAYGLRRGNLTMRSVPIPRHPTYLTLFRFASRKGSPLEPLCSAQIGGLAVATFITLLLVPVFYSIAVLDLKIVKWEKAS